MTYPDAGSIVTVTAQIWNGVAPATGSVVFTIPKWLTEATGDAVIAPVSIPAVLGGTNVIWNTVTATVEQANVELPGGFSIVLPRQSAFNPSNWAYTVELNIDGMHPITFSVPIDADTDLSSLIEEALQ